METIQGPSLPDAQGALLKEVLSSSISAANTEIAAVLQPLAAQREGGQGNIPQDQC